MELRTDHAGSGGSETRIGDQHGSIGFVQEVADAGSKITGRDRCAPAQVARRIESVQHIAIAQQHPEDDFAVG